MSYGLAMDLCVLFCLDSWGFFWPIFFLLQRPSLFFWSAGFFSGGIGPLAGLLQPLLRFYVFDFTSLHELGCSLLSSVFPLIFFFGLLLFDFFSVS